MNHIYFAWVDPGTVFASSAHARNDEAVFSFSVTEREGEFPAASVRIVAPAVGLLAPGRKHWAFISEDDGAGSATLLFSGRLTAFPRDAGNGTAEIELIAQPTEWKETLDAFAATLRVHPYWDPLFFDAGQDAQPEDALAGRPAHYHWHRATGALSLVSLLAGNETADLSGLHYWDGFSFSVGDAPVRSVALKVSASWTQQASGTVDIADEVRNALGDDPAYISTLTGSDLESSWPRAGQSIGNASGYTVLAASLTEAIPGTSTGCEEWESGRGYAAGDIVLRREDMATAECLIPHIAGDFASDLELGCWDTPTPLDDSARPLRSAEATVQTADFPTGDPAEDMGNETRSLRLARRWYAPELSIAWDYGQARTETATATLDAGIQDIAFDDGGNETMEFSLSDITIDTTTPAWRSGMPYIEGDLVKFSGLQFRCLADHTSGHYFGIDRFAGRWQQMANDQSPLGNVAKPSFFLTDRGRQAFEHALARAAAKIASASRCIEISFDVPWDAGRDITTAHSVTITDPRLPAGLPVTGKVTSVTLSRDASAAKISITMALAVGDGASPTPVEDEHEVSGISGLIYADYASQAAPEPVAIGSMDSAAYVVREVEAANDVAAQNAALTASSGNPMGAVLPTSFSLHLRSLAADDTLEHEIAVEAPHAYSPPKQIDLGAS